MPGEVPRDRAKADDPVVVPTPELPNISDLVSAFGKQDVKVEIDTLTTFANKIEALLQTMEGSAAAPDKLQEQKLTGKALISGAYSGDVVEATALTAAYDKVHTQLVKLHTDFVSQIEAMKTAVAKTAGSYAGNEEATAAAHKAVATSYGPVTQATGANRPAHDGFQGW
ncbi:hypothetical protein KV557_16460 [Kitasatospora aureofaciens]|uniref:hypothetical protein n=1 Tax=Kitasatospora aureofaciens TaxID=1894 RepID=UPI001C471E19|nr:hypothetical protein [Kitasatospora aureofaciens]MBV6698697.1 hypothetical protein [Kitasatospora aureofaciens]